MTLPSGYPYVSIVLLVVLAFAAYEDLKKRKITTITFLILDIALLIYYIFVDYWIALFLIPVIMEFFAKKFSLVPYVLLLVPLVFNLSVVTISLSYSILLMKLFGTLIKNFGRGDVKALQTLAVAMPLYPHLPTLDSLFPPVLAVTLMASIIGTAASVVRIREQRSETTIRNFTAKGASEQIPKEKFWTAGQKRVYKIPFVTFMAVGYVLLLILSLLRLV